MYALPVSVGIVISFSMIAWTTYYPRLLTEMMLVRRIGVLAMVGIVALLFLQFLHVGSVFSLREVVQLVLPYVGTIVVIYGAYLVLFMFFRRRGRETD